jgi:hypothetical protein
MLSFDTATGGFARRAARADLIAARSVSTAPASVRGDTVSVRGRVPVDTCAVRIGVGITTPDCSTAVSHSAGRTSTSAAGRVRVA